MKRTIINGLIVGLSTGLLAACGGGTDSSSGSKMLATTTACYPAWNSTTAYNGGAQVSYANVNYVANWWTQGQNPSTNNGGPGSGQPWTSQGACGSTPTPTPAPTPTPTPAPTPAPTPTPTPAPTPTPTSTCTLQAEDYSNAYDDTTGNAGGAYRTGDVDIEATSDTGGGYDVGWIDTGEWLAHNNVTFPTTGSYTFQYRVASINSTGVISSDLNAGSIQLGTTAIPNTGGWQTWTTVQRTVTVNAGTYNVGTYMSTGGFNLNWIKIVGASCSPTPTPTPTPAPTPTPTPTGSVVFSAYKDISVNADWNTDQMRTAVTGSTIPVTQAMTGKNTTLTWAFATGECGSENWAGMAAGQFASTNVPMFTNAGKKYIVSTGGAAGSFTCGSDSGFSTFVNRYSSANMIGVDFDIETGQTQSTIDNLVARAKTAGIRASFTIATLAQNNGASSSAVDLGSSSPDSLNSTGAMVINSIKSHGLTNYTINLMTMDYGTGTGVCVMSGSTCNMGQSAIQAAMNLHGHYGIPYNHIELTPMNGQNDTANNVFSLSDAATMSSWARSNGIAGVHYWSMDRDPNLSYANQFISSLGL